ncbi:hypothetical protein [Microbispora sp. KK1-11]|uniref:hypothetical protein n=1 Tax=Microbispora sp. KK1-11 TaxID=2053005 RepID=UPI0011589AB5|nr:hypothetical protein [Microbispora sp. KK1-11]TQS26352.1 hypothetical protein FLW16_25165 [Microbispora sp. KK1-11]
MLRSRWIAGPAVERPGPLVAALTDFRTDRMLDLPGIARRGLSLSRLWPSLPGAVDRAALWRALTASPG